MGKLIRTSEARLLQIGFEALCVEHRGQSCIQSNVHTIPHPAGPYLKRLRSVGAPVLQHTAPWSHQRRLQALRRGCHKSAKGYAQFLRDEMADMVKAGHWIVLPASRVLHLPRLRLSPIGVIPQRDRRPRTIIDYSFHGVNQDTVRLAPPSMQFGRALHRVLQQVRQADPRQGPVYLSKIDMADAYMRVPLQIGSIAALGALLPKHRNEPPMVAFPLILPMGWVESPPYFCAVSETITDLTNQALRTRPLQYRPHRLEPAANSHPPRQRLGPRDTQQDLSTKVGRERPTGRRLPPLAYADVYMDDELAVAQGSALRRQQVRQACLHSVDQVLRPLQASDRAMRKEPVSIKKLKKGDAYWATRKSMLGWLLDTRQGTIHLPEHRRHRLDSILHSIAPVQTSTSLRKWRQLLGELRSMATAIPAAAGFYSHLQLLLPTDPKLPSNTRLRLTPSAHRALDNFRWLTGTLRARPTRLAELYPSKHPHFVGAVDASAVGMGGVWFGDKSPPLYWRCRFPPAVTAAVVSWDNPTGTVTNSDLELAGAAVHLDVLASVADVREKTLHVLSDNTAAITWHTKGSTSSLGPRSFLLEQMAIHQRQHRYCARLSHIPGIQNQMADELSRLWHLSDPELSHHFHVSHPQASPWTHLRPRPKTLSAVTSALWRRPWTMAQRQRAAGLGPMPLPSGPTCWRPTTKSHGLSQRPQHGPGSSCSRTGTGRDTSPHKGDLSSLGQWRMPFDWWRRPTFWLTSQT